MKARSISTLLACLVMGVSLNAGAADQPRIGTQTQTQAHAKKEDVIYGSQLMTYKERRAYRAKMRSLKTTEEREALRRRHHEEMQARARRMGKTLPDEPPAQGMGMGRGMGPGGGMGPGMGPGGGMGPARP